MEHESKNPYMQPIHPSNLTRLRVVVSGREYDVPTPVGEEIEKLRECLSEIEDLARGEGALGNVIAGKVAAQLRPEPPFLSMAGTGL